MGWSCWRASKRRLAQTLAEHPVSSAEAKARAASLVEELAERAEEEATSQARQGPGDMNLAALLEETLGDEWLEELA
ncbi:MAG: hypothetical protein PHS96_05900 [Anaerolineales bacterium]|nr:hypothetical protein [Anaerolineales bacterium]